MEVYNLCHCGDEIEPKRWALGFRECLMCGERQAIRQKARLANCLAPAYNKGAMQLVYSRDDALLIGRK